MAVPNVLLLTRELATVTAVSAALQSNGKLNTEDVCQHLSDLASRLARAPAPAALVDIDDQANGILPAIEPLIRKYPDTRFVVLSRQMRQELLLEAMQVGARHFMLKETIGADLSEVLRRLCRRGGHVEQGSVVTVLSSGGGCGATTVAVNLAAELQLLNGQQALLVDLDHCYGGVGAYLGLDGEYGLIDLLARPGPIDAELIRTTAMSRSEQLHAMISTPRSRLGEPVATDPQRVGEFVTACKSAYTWTVVDAPRVPPAVATELAKRSVATLILLQLTIKDLRVAKLLRSRLLADGLWPGAVRPVVTRFHKRGLLITLEQARRVLGLNDQEQLGYLSSDYWAVAKALNMGKSLAEEQPRSVVRREIQVLASELSESARTKAAARVG